MRVSNCFWYFCILLRESAYRFYGADLDGESCVDIANHFLDTRLVIAHADERRDEGDICGILGGFLTCCLLRQVDRSLQIDDDLLCCLLPDTWDTGEERVILELDRSYEILFAQSEECES